MNEPNTIEEQSVQEAEAIAVAIATYLQNHPDLFLDYPHLLETLQLPSSSGGNAVSLVERQMALLREKSERQERQLNQLKQNAQENERLLLSLQRLIIDLLDSRTLDEAIGHLRHTLTREFYADIVTLYLFSEERSRSEYLSRTDSRLKPLEGLIKRQGTICGPLKAEQAAALFTDHSEPILSSVVIPICRHESPCIGLLAIGSSNRNRYHPDMGTLFVSHLGAILHKILTGHLERGG